MKYHGLTLRPMQESGGFLLRAMQNEDMPRLDLLVRESVQNALDAALDRNAGGRIRIGFALRDHTTETIASILSEGIDRKMLMARHPNGGRMLEIRDSLTEGLTGPTSFEEIGPDGKHGNLLKLVYEIGRTRGDTDAGGSWGLGKTCYFRMGIGLVIYYSRIRTSNGYEERLVASLVEDENSPDKLQRDTRTGIGWWGAEGQLKPVTGSTQIGRVLDMLRINRFTATETGTSIIIPFLRDDLIETADTDDTGNPGDTASRPWWYQNTADYIRIALQRWFCARLDNPHFATGPALEATVDGKSIAADTMLPVFRTLQALYNRATGAKIGPGDYLSVAEVPDDMIRIRAVEPRGVFKPSGPAGDVAAVLLTPDQLGMGPPFNQYDPAMCVFGRPGEKPPYHPLVTFMRRPGMCISWEDSTDNRGWAGGMPGVSDNSYMVALFIPRQERKLASAGRRERDHSAITLESYLRGCERADHAAWHDAAGLRIVEKIRLNCGRILREFGTRPSTHAPVAHSIRMARNLADLVLPERGMGADGRSGLPSRTRSGGGRAGGSGGRRGTSAVPILELKDVEFTADGLSVRWSLEWGSADMSAPRKICIRIDSESGPISLQQWLDDGLGKFPFHVASAAVQFVDQAPGAAKIVLDIDCDDGVKLRNPEGCNVDTLAGVLMIKLSGGELGALRPVLSATIIEPAGQNA